MICVKDIMVDSIDRLQKPQGIPWNFSQNQKKL